MDHYRLEIFARSNTQTLLRFLCPDGQLRGQRELPPADVETFVTEVECEYRKSIRALEDMGRRLHEWLDGPTPRWLVQAREESRELAWHIDVRYRLRHLP
jgi:hypothetical protein